MVKINRRVKSSFIFGIVLILSLSTLLLYSFADVGSNRYPNGDVVDTAIESGKSQLFSRTVSGSLAAYQTFQDAYSTYYGSAATIQKIRVRVYLATSRMFDFVFRNDGGTADTMTEFLEQYGITRTGDDFDDLEISEPLFNSDDQLILPETAPDSAEALRSFLAGPFVSALDASIADMDAAIGLLNPFAESKEIVAAALIDPEDPTQPDVEIDDGDYYLFRAFLKLTKSYILLLKAYNMDIDIKEVAALGNMGAFNMKAIKDILDRNANILKIMTTGGTPSYASAAKLAEAKTAFIGAVDDYVIASEKIRNDVETTAGADELFSLDQDSIQEELLLRDQLVEVKNSLTANRVAQIGPLEAEWDFTLLNTGRHLGFWFADGYFIDGDYETTDGPCNFTGCCGEIDYSVISGNTIDMYVYYYGYPGGRAKFTGTLNAQRTAISSGTYYSYDYGSGGWIPQGTFTAYRVDVEDERVEVNLNPLYGNGVTALSLRDLLPQLNQFGYPERGTMGYGLGNDYTLGGILPFMESQDDWTREFDMLQPSGNVTITSGRTMGVQDGGITDWSGISPVFTDIIDEEDNPGEDVTALYLAKDETYYYVRMDMAGTIPMNGYKTYSVQLKKLPGDEYQMNYDRQIFIWYNPYGMKWEITVRILSYGEYPLADTEFQVFGSYIEMRLPHALMGETGGRFINVHTPWESNETCLQITPTASLSGTLTVPGYDETGLVYIGVYQYNAGLKRDERFLLGNKVIRAGDYTAGMAYAINHLPLGENVFVFVHWDRDLNGVVTPGDYTNIYMPLTLAQNSTLDINASEERISYPAPEFKHVSIFCIHNPYHSPNVAMLSFLKSTGPGDVAVTVRGPGGMTYDLAPTHFFDYKLGVQYSTSVPYLPDGNYVFEAVDSLGRKATATYYYAYNESLPFISNISPASGSYVGTTTPTLSWTPPAGNYYYQVLVLDMESKVGLFISSLLPSSQTSITIPDGLLKPNTPYIWVVRMFDSNTHRMNATQMGASFYTGNQQALSINSAALYTVPPSYIAPWYKHYCYMNIPGVAWWNIASFKVYKDTTVYYGEGKPWDPWDPSSSYYMDGRLFGAERYLVSFTTGSALSDGDYTLEVQSVFGETATYALPYSYSNVPSAVNMSSFDPANKYYFSTLTPTFSWAAIPEANAWYRLRIIDGTNADVNPGKRIKVWQSSWTTETSINVPAGILQPGASYYWQIGSTISTGDPNVLSGNVTNWNNNETAKMWLFTIQAPRYGDINLDYQVDIADAIMAMQTMAGLNPSGISEYYVSKFHPVIKSEIDVNADNRIGSAEVIYILQKAAELR
ncbi:MAG: hypothetical protein JXA41_02360 [Deltaproteobacteria bacterium]|nr:hypothetical protein [Deltaproteobacteria bacterium]